MNYTPINNNIHQNYNPMGPSAMGYSPSSYYPQSYNQNNSGHNLFYPGPNNNMNPINGNKSSIPLTGNNIPSNGNKYEFLKKQLEDIKQIEIDYLIYLNEGNNYEVLKKEIVDTINLYSNFTTDEETIEEIIKQKNNIIKLSQDLFNRYNKIKMQLLNYTKNLKDLQTFNQLFQSIVQEKFNFIKKRLNNINSNPNLNLNINYDSGESILKTDFLLLIMMK